MATGHTVEDMADHYAQMIIGEFEGQVDAVVGLSHVGMILQYLA